MKKRKIYTQLYVMMLEGAILTPDKIMEFSEHYGEVGSALAGWRPPKKIYYTIGTCRAAKRYLPAEIREKVEIHLFESKGKVE